MGLQMDKLNWKNILMCIFSGILGVILNILYVHFISPPQSFTFIYDGEEVVVTQERYENVEEENRILSEQNTTLQKELWECESLIKELQKQIEEKEGELENNPNVTYYTSPVLDKLTEAITITDIPV